MLLLLLLLQLMLLLLPSRPPALPARPARPLARGLHLHTGLATGGQPSRRRSSGLNFALYCPPSPSPPASRLRPPTRRQLVRQPVVSVASRPPAIALAFPLPPPPADRHASLPAALSSRLSPARPRRLSPTTTPAWPPPCRLAYRPPALALAPSSRHHPRLTLPPPRRSLARSRARSRLAFYFLVIARISPSS